VAYLIAITPELQSSLETKRRGEEKKAKAMEAVREMQKETSQPAGGDGSTESDAGNGPAAPPSAADPAKAKSTYEQVCSQCHELKDVDDHPPKTPAEVDQLIERMVGNGLDESKENLSLVRQHLIRAFVK
jgi:hypothetical protein